MKTDNPDIESRGEIITREQDESKAINGAALSARLAKDRKRDLKKYRNANQFRAIPISYLESLVQLGGGMYRAVVVSAYAAHLWDGWKSKKETKRRPNNNVMLTRRMMAQHFGMCAKTVARALSDLVRYGLIDVAKKAVFSGKQGKNLGTMYRLPWMENPKGKRIKVYWGLLISDAFLGLSVTLQAVIILLHRHHNRTKNRLTIRPCALEQFGIHRNRLPGYIQQLLNAGLLLLIENRDYEFTWIDSDGKPDFYRLKKISMHLSVPGSAPKCPQGEGNE
jgi:hypothetical protein